MIPQAETIWNEFNEKLRHFIRKRVTDQHITEEILQETFIKIHSRLHTLKDKSKIRSWIYQITRNNIVDHFRGTSSAHSYIDNEPVDDHDISESEALLEINECVRSLIHTLPDNDRQALILTEYEGLKQKELAEKLGISLSGAKSRIQRARDKLRNLLLTDCHTELIRTGINIEYQVCCPKCCAQQ